MFIKEIKKNNSPTGKVFYQYQLAETYRVEGKVRHNNILYLGSHKLLNDKENRNTLAKLLEHKIRNNDAFSDEFQNIPKEIKDLGAELYSKYKIKHIKPEEAVSPVQEPKKEFTGINLDSMEISDTREIGAEWMCYQMMDRLGLRDFLLRKGWSESKADLGYISIISRAVASYSEHKTEFWLRDNSGLTELFDKPNGSVSRHDLYKIANELFALKPELEAYLYNKLTTLFNVDDTILIYDLTNTHFEGKKLAGSKAQYGRNKQKRNDCKQIVLAAVVNESGFLKYSNIYEGNMSEPKTLIDIINKMNASGSTELQKRLIVIDAGIATEDNLKLLQDNGLLYVCVSRSNPKKASKIDLAKSKTIFDKRKNEIKLQIMEVPDSLDTWVCVNSSQKRLKEDSMMQKEMQRFEKEMATVKAGISKKGGTKLTEKVYERIGRIKERNRRVHNYYEITTETEDGKVIKLEYNKKDMIIAESQNGEYYLRTNLENTDEIEIWNIYNTIREVESTFRCLKSDLRLRPVFHQTDRNTDSHLHLGLLAYQIVSAIRFMLKENSINMDWRNIVRVMNTQKTATVSMNAEGDVKIIIRQCSRPMQEAMEIYKSLKMSSLPFRRKKFVVSH